MKLKRRRDWKRGRSIVNGRSRGGQINLKKLGPSAGSDTFLVRIGKDGSRQVVGSPTDARKALRELRQELDGGTYVPSRNTRVDHFFEQVFLAEKRQAVKPKTFGEYVRIFETYRRRKPSGVRPADVRDHLERDFAATDPNTRP